MADVRNQLAELYVRVVADTAAAEAGSKKIADAYRDAAKTVQESIDKQAKARDAIAKKGDQITDKQKRDILKRMGLEQLASEKLIKLQENYIKVVEKAAKSSDRAAKQARYQSKIIEGELNLRQRQYEDYLQFLRGAASEHSRFGARLSQRDFTRSTIENIRRGFEKGILIGNKWHRDENAIQRIARGIEVAGTAFYKMRTPAGQAMHQFQSLQRIGYSLQSVFGALAGSIGALVGGILGLVGVAGQAVYSIAAIGGAFASVGVGFIAARVAMGGISQAVSTLTDSQNSYNRSIRDAKRNLRDLRFEVEEAALSEEEAALRLEKSREELARVQDLPPDSRLRREVENQFKQDELNYRRTIARAKDARLNLARGPLYGTKMQDPLRKLTESQKVFARYLAGLKPILMDLKEAAASGFLPILQNSIQTVVSKAIPTLKTGLNILGQAMGTASKSFADAFTTPENLKLLADFFKASKPIIESFGRILGNTYTGVLNLLKAAEPITKRFAGWVERASVNFEKWSKSPALTSFLNLAGAVAASLGGTLRTIFDGLKNVINATFPGGNIEAGAGGVILHWLRTLAEGFKAFTGSPDFAIWLQNSTKNATTALSAIGALLKPLLDMAAMPEIGQFWTVLRGAAEPIAKMLTDGALAAPEFAAMLVSILKMFAAFSDSGALKAFFNTLKAIADVITAVFNNPIVKSFLDFIGRIHGVFLAIGLALIVARTAMLVFSGIVSTVFTTVGGIASGMTRISARTIAVSQEFARLRGQGYSVSKSISASVTELLKVRRANIANRNISMLLKMAQDAGMAKEKVRALKVELETLAATQKVSGMSGLVAGSSLAGQAGYAGAARMSRFAGGRAAAGLAGGAMMLGAMAGTGGGPATQFLGTATMFASMIPGIGGLIAGAVGGVGTLIASVLESDAQKKKDEAQRKAQEKITIQAKNAELYAEKVQEIQSKAANLITAGATAKTAKSIITKSEDALSKAGISDASGVFAKILQGGFASTFATGTDKVKSGVITAVSQAIKSELLGTPEETISALNTIFSGAGGGAGGLSAIQKFIKEKGLDTYTVGSKFGSTTPTILTTKAATTAVEKTTRSTIAKGAAELLAPKQEKLGKAISTLSGMNQFSRTGEQTSTRVLFSLLKAGGLDFSKVGKDFLGTYSVADLLSQARSQYRTNASNLSNLNYQGATGLMPTFPLAGTGTADAAANKMSYAANVMANVATASVNRPTYIIINTDKKATNSNAGDLLGKWVLTGVVPVPYTGPQG